MAITNREKMAVTAKLNTGQTASGATIYGNVAIGTLDVTRYDPDKALAIVSALAPCLNHSVTYVQQVETSSIETD